MSTMPLAPSGGGRDANAQISPVHAAYFSHTRLSSSLSFRVMAAQKALCVLLLLFVVTGHAALKNFTIDDTLGDEGTGIIPSYTGSNTWRARTKNEDCTVCTLQPDPSKLHSRTWHESTTFTGQDEIKFKFTGTALWAYGILAGVIDKTQTRVHLTLTVDDKTVDTFDWSPTDKDPAYQYNVMMLAAKGLDNTLHEVAIVSSGQVIDGVSWGTSVMFDYAVYAADLGQDATTTPPGTTITTPGPTSTDPTGTTPATTSSTPVSTGSANLPGGTTTSHGGPVVVASARPNVGLYLGLGIGVGLLIAICAGLVVFFLVRRHRRAGSDLTQPAPWGLDMSSTAALPPSSSPYATTPSYHTDTMRSVGATPLSVGAPLVVPLADEKMRHRIELAQRDQKLPGYTPSPASAAGSSVSRD